MTLLGVTIFRAVTKSGTGTWDLGLGKWGREDVETRARRDARTSKLGGARGLEEVINKQDLTFAC